MPKNKGKGGKNRRRGKNENEGVKRELVFKEDGQEYAQVCWLHTITQTLSLVSGLIGKYFQVTKMLGNGRLEAMCFDGVKRLCHIRGKLRKKVILLPDICYGILNCTLSQVWINQSDIILVGLRDYQDAKADVIQKYSADEARNLKSYGEFPESIKINETVDFVGGDLDDDIEFDDVDSDDSGSDDADDIDGI